MKDGFVFRFLCISAFVMCVGSLMADDKDFDFSDPLRPYGQPDQVSPVSVASQQLRVEAVVMSEFRGAHVVINSEPLMIGERVNGFKITDISSDYIELLHDERNESVKIPVPRLSSDVEKMLEGVRRKDD